MSGIAIKITSLLIRTVSKPIASRIKAQAREHPTFRRVCVGWAQYLHRVDMRLRLGLLNDPAKYERQAAREAEAAAKRKREAETPTVKTEAQTRADEEKAERARKAGEAGSGNADGAEKAKTEEPKPKIKPLSEAKAIDMGANFIAESFLFAVAVGTLFWDQYRSRKKEATRRNDVADKLAELEERDRLKNQRIEEMEASIRELKGHPGWQWPWRKGGDEHKTGAGKGDESHHHSSIAAIADGGSQRSDHSTDQTVSTADGPTTQAIRAMREKQAIEKGDTTTHTNVTETADSPAQESSKAP